MHINFLVAILPSTLLCTIFQLRFLIVAASGTFQEVGTVKETVIEDQIVEEIESVHGPLKCMFKYCGFF